MANELHVAERKSIDRLSLENFISLVLVFYPTGSVCLIAFFNLGQNQPDRHEISVYAEKLCSFLFSCLSKLNILNFSCLQHACPAGMLLVLFAERWCWIKEQNSSLSILHFPYPWLTIKDFSFILVLPSSFVQIICLEHFLAWKYVEFGPPHGNPRTSTPARKYCERSLLQSK